MNFFTETALLREKIKKCIEGEISRLPDPRVRQILLQRQSTASFIKGISAYHIHRGLSGPFSNDENIRFSAALEIYSTGLVISDNIVDGHEARNGVTTLLKEHGVPLNLLAVQYATHFGLISFGPYIERFQEITDGLGLSSIGEVLLGVLTMDVDHPSDPQSAVKAIGRVNGLTLAVPLALSASTARCDKQSVIDVFQYAYNTGIAFGLYEEIRDLLGEHGRERASELSSGRMPYCLLLFAEKQSNFDPRVYAGKKLTDEQFNTLIHELEQGGVLSETATQVQTYLNIGIEKLRKHLTGSNLVVFELLAQTVTNHLRKFASK